MTTASVHIENLLRKRLKELDITTLDALGSVSVALIAIYLAIDNDKTAINFNKIFPQEKARESFYDTLNTALFIVEPFFNEVKTIKENELL